MSWVQFSSKDHGMGSSSKARVIPARVGLLWTSGPVDGTRFYLGAMVGAYMQKVMTESNGVGSSIEKTYLGFAPCLGVHIPVDSNGNQIELQASYDVWTDDETSMGEDRDMGFVRLGVGFRFAI